MKEHEFIESSLYIPESEFKKLREHLLPKQIVAEECAFLFVNHHCIDERAVFIYEDSFFLKSSDFVFRSKYYFELKDIVRAKMIKRAHNKNFILVEVHSHIEQEVAEFSPTDWIGFKDFVPHIIWRLKGKPYIAMVFTATGFDGLIWFKDKKRPIVLNKIIAGNFSIKSSKESIKYLDNGKEI